MRTIEAKKEVLPKGCLECDFRIRESRGPLFMQMRRHFLDRYGEAGWKRLLTSVSPECQEAFKSELGVWEWVDSRHAWELSEVFLRDVGPDGLKTRGRLAAEEYLGGLSAWFMRLASPSFLVINLPHIWRFYHRGGVVTIDEQTEKGAQVSLWVSNGYAGLFSVALKNWMEKAMEMAGARGISVVYHPPPDVPEDTSTFESCMAIHRHLYTICWED